MLYNLIKDFWNYYWETEVFKFLLFYLVFTAFCKELQNNKNSKKGKIEKGEKGEKAYVYIVENTKVVSSFSRLSINTFY